MKKKQMGKMTGLFLASTLLFGACTQAGESGNEAGVPSGNASLAQGETVSSSGNLAAQQPGVEGTPANSAEKTTGMEKTPGQDTTQTVPVNGTIPVDEAHFPDPAFREYLLAYVDKDGDHKLSEDERGAVAGLGSVAVAGGLADKNFTGDNLERGEKLRAVQSLAGIEYFQNLEEINFSGAYQLKELSLNNPKLLRVRLMTHTLDEFSIKNAPQLCSLVYTAKGKQDIAWGDFQELTGLNISEAEVAMEDLAECKKLDALTLSGCKVTMPEDAKAFAFPCLKTMEWYACDIIMPLKMDVLGFSYLPWLEKFCYSEPKGQEGLLARELDFGENGNLKEVSFGEKEIAEKLILGNMDVDFITEAEWKNCEVAFEPETKLDQSEVLPEGDIWLTAENFPDVAFRQYLYHFADHDKNLILSKKEISEILAIDPGDIAPDIPPLERQKKITLLKRVYCFDGIAYFGDLRRVSLDYDSVVTSLRFDNPALLEINLPKTLGEISIQHPENLQVLSLGSECGMELDLSQMRSLREINVANVTADFSYLTQNKYLEEIYLTDCTCLKEVEEYDFSGLRNLERVTITKKEGSPVWAQRMRFPDSGLYYWDVLDWNWMVIGDDVTKQVLLESKKIHCHAKNSEVIYLDDVPGEDVVLPEGGIWNGTEYIEDGNLRCYLYYALDQEQDNILTLGEREGLTRFVDTGYNYAYLPNHEENEYRWKVEDDFSPYVYGITSLRGLEYFPKLKCLQLEKMELTQDVREIVVKNPELEVLDLRFNGNVETIDLTACKNLRVCVIDSTRDDDFVQEVKPTILLPEHLELETVKGMDCVVGENAQARLGRKKY